MKNKNSKNSKNRKTQGIQELEEFKAFSSISNCLHTTFYINIIEMNTAQAKTDDVPTKEKLLSLVDDIELISKVRQLVCIRIAS